MRKNRWYATHSLVLALLLVASRGAAGQVITFETLGQGAPEGTGPKGPTVYIAYAPEDFDKFLPFVASEHHNSIKSTDLSTYVIVAVFLGSAPSSGYAINVQDLFLREDRLNVAVTVRRPAPDQNARPAYTAPYHIIKIPREDFGSTPPLSWAVLEIIAQGNHTEQ